MKKFFKIAGISVVALVAMGWIGIWFWSRHMHAQAAPEALAAMASDSQVIVESGEDIVFRPAGRTPAMGVILYPGASCDIRGYAPVLRRVAAAGYLVVDASMPLEYALFAPNKAQQIMAAHPEINRWVLIGHSMGGAMAGTFVKNHPQHIAGLVMWDAYPASSLAESALPVWVVHRAQLNGTPPAWSISKRGTFPAATHWTPIPGGIHMFFGAFTGGGYREDWAPQITRDAQHEQQVAATLAALQAMGGPAS